MDKLYAQHENTIRERAWAFSQKTGRDYGDMLGVCHEAFMYAAARWEPGRGASFNSLLATCCTQHMIQYTRKVDYAAELLIDEPALMPGPSARLELLDILKELSEEAISVIDVLFNAPAELLQELGDRSHTPRLLRGALGRVCTRRGMDHNTVMACYDEIRIALAKG